ncbi:MAG TPA: lipoyl domain-containing protein, partial [Solirubrobacteraceae bacterium]|nr:lipoyl domain-containing protein [Solirubrobacteraceae bacterium]
MSEVVMPRLSDSMEEGTILKWLKGTGDQVALGEPIAEIETDKATMTYEADGAGYLQIVAPEGETLAIGAVIAHLLASAEEAAAAPVAPAAPAAAAAAP